MSSLGLRVVPCQERQPFCPQTASPPGSIPICAIVVASAIQNGTLTIIWDKTEATIVAGTETVKLSGGTYDQHFEWVFMPLVAGRTIHFKLTAKAGSLIQTAEYPVEV